MKCVRLLKMLYLLYAHHHNQNGGMTVSDAHENERGTVTIEATISLSVFMFTIVTILTIVNICIVQAKVSYAINSVAKEISQYSYLYSLTGLHDREGEIYNAAKEDTKEVENVLTDINTVYNEIENLGQTGKQSYDNIDSILSAWDEVNDSVDNISSAGSSAMQSIEKIAEDPKNLLFGIAKLGSVKAFDLVKSKLIAAPLAKIMCKKNLVDQKDGDVDAYLKFLGVVPSVTGSYIDGLDFSNSTLFPYGSSEIRINVQYDVKVIPLLPIKATFHFNQTAVTHGWLAGDVSFQTADKIVENNTLWTQTSVNERSNYIRHLGIGELTGEGYKKTAGLTDVPLYSEENKEFVMIASMNPLWSADGEPPKTLEDISDVAIQESIERLSAKMNSTTEKTNGSVTLRTKENGTSVDTKVDCAGSSNKVILVVPEDEGLKERIEEIIAKSNTSGVEFEVIARYGNGARATAEKKKEEE